MIDKKEPTIISPYFKGYTNPYKPDNNFSPKPPVPMNPDLYKNPEISIDNKNSDNKNN